MLVRIGQFYKINISEFHHEKDSQINVCFENCYNHLLKGVLQ